MSTETIFLDTEEVKISNARLVVKGKTYALAGVTSYRKQSKEIPQTSKGMWWVLLVLLVIVLLLPSIALVVSSPNLGSFVFTGVLIGLAFLIYKRIKNYKKKYLHTLYLSIASGEVAAYETQDGSYASAIESALTEAVIHRG